MSMKQNATVWKFRQVRFFTQRKKAAKHPYYRATQLCTVIADVLKKGSPAITQSNFVYAANLSLHDGAIPELPQTFGGVRGEGR